MAGGATGSTPRPCSHGNSCVGGLRPWVPTATRPGVISGCPVSLARQFKQRDAETRRSAARVGRGPQEALRGLLVRSAAPSMPEGGPRLMAIYLLWVTCQAQQGHWRHFSPAAPEVVSSVLFYRGSETRSHWLKATQWQTLASQASTCVPSATPRGRWLWKRLCSVSQGRFDGQGGTAPLPGTSWFCSVSFSFKK